MSSPSRRARASTAASLLVFVAAGAVLAGCSSRSAFNVSPPANNAADAPELFAAKAGAWSLKAPMPTARTAAVAAAIGTKIYVVGGINVAAPGTPLAVNEIYDTVHDRWSSGAPMPTPRWTLGAAVVNGKLYVVGGQVAGGGQSNAFEVYDPVHDSWSAKAPMPTSRDSLSAAAVGNFVYAIGGYAGSRLTTVERYDTVHNTWLPRAPMTVGKSGSSVAVVGSVIYAAGGLSNQGVTGDNESYQVAANSWTTRAPETNLRQAACASAIGNVLYAAGGASANGGPLGTVDSFSVTTQRWKKAPVMPQAAMESAGAEVNGKLYCFGGSNQGYPTSSTLFYNDVQMYAP